MSDASSLKVLLVDDEPSLCEVAKVFLEDLFKYEVSVCSSANMAKALLLSQQFDAVVCDYQMPVEDGISLLKWLRQSGLEVPFILFTGKGREEVAIQALNEGADFYLQKGAEPRVQFIELGNMIKKAAERSCAQKALRDSERKYRLLAENVKDVIFELDIDTLRFTYISPSIMNLRGMTPEEAMQESAVDAIDQESSERLMAEMRRRLQNFHEHPELMQPYRTVVKQKRKDGNLIDVEVTASIVLDQNGKPCRVIGVSRDISDRIRVERELRESNRRLQTLMSNLPGMAYRCRNDPYWTMEFVSEGCLPLTGYTSSDLIHNNKVAYADLILPEDLDMVWTKVQEAIQQNVPFFILYRIRRADGKIRWVREQGRGILSENGEVVALEGFIQDITEEREALNKLALANKKLNLLGSITRHDSYNILTVIRGQAELGKMRSSEKSTMELFRSIDRQAVNLQKVFDFANMYQELYSQEPVWLNLREIIEKATSELVENAKIRVLNEVSGYEVCADTMLVKVIYNLIDNTLRHGVRASKAVFYCVIENEELRLIYEDDGLGIPESDKERIFQRGVGQNLGFGLFLSREILSITDIAIKENGVPGKGVRFIITVPAARYRRIEAKKG
ncbi:MAG: PAS domain S-box protein [Methanomassiliicoccales archaeon]